MSEKSKSAGGKCVVCLTHQYIQLRSTVTLAAPHTVGLALAVEQISYSSSSRTLSLHFQAKYGIGCVQEENNTDTDTGRSPEQTARIYSNDRNCDSSLDPSLVLIQNSSYKIRNSLGTNKEPS